MRTVLKKVGYWLVYALFLLAFVGIVDYFFFYRPYIEKVRAHKVGLVAQAQDTQRLKLPTVRHISPEDMKLLGKAENEKISSFSNFEPTKEQGKVRICALGDSFTAGDEVDETHDYPTRLGKIFAAEGARNVEVLNFGIGGYGFHQAYMMWDLVASKFDCDIHLLGPRGFQPLRDTTFGYIYHWSPYYLHARYVLEGGDTRRIEISGDTYGERFDSHFRFIQPWKYLRYSRSAPIFLKAMLPEGRDLGNPFYYDRRPMEEEAADLQKVLLAKMASSGSLFFVGHHRPSVIESATDNPSDNMGAAAFHEVTSFPYVAPQTHAGSWGNDYLARQFFAHLTGRGAEPLVVSEFLDLEWPKQDGVAGQDGVAHQERRSLSSYDKVEFALGDVKIGQFSKNSAPKVDALMSIHQPDQGVLDSCFFPMDFELEPGMEVILRVESSAGAQDHVIGRISVLDQFNIGVSKIEGFEFWQFKDFEHMQERGKPSPLTHGKQRVSGLFFTGGGALSLDQLSKGKISVLVDNKPALQGEWGQLGLTPGVWFRPVRGPFRIPRANTSGLVDLEALPEDTGTIDIVAEHWEDGTVRVPIVGWRKKSVASMPAVRSLPKVLSIQPDGTAILKNRP